MEFRQLEMFVRLVENESFSLTAKELGVSQPTISFNLKQLEEELDTPLFIRTTRELKLTSDGAKLYDDAKVILSYKDRVLDGFTKTEIKNITVGVSTISGSYILPNFLKDFLKDNSNIRIDIRETNSLQTIKKVANYEVDLGIVGMVTDNELCEFKPIFEDEFVFICPNNDYYRKLKESKPKLSTLVKEPLISREPGSGIKNSMDELLVSENINLDELNITLSANDEELVKKLVCMGLGTSFISKIAVEEMVKEGKIIAISLENYPARFRNLYLVWNKKVTLPSHVKRFIDYILETDNN